MEGVLPVAVVMRAVHRYAVTDVEVMPELGVRFESADEPEPANDRTERYAEQNADHHDHRRRAHHGPTVPLRRIGRASPSDKAKYVGRCRLRRDG